MTKPHWRPPGELRAAPLPRRCRVPPVRAPGQDFHLRSQTSYLAHRPTGSAPRPPDHRATTRPGVAAKLHSRLRSDPPPTCRAGGSLRPAARRWVCRDAGAGIKGLAVGVCQTRRMPPYDTAVDAANAAKRTAALLRDARGVQRRLDKLAAGMADASAPAQRSLSEARDAVARVITGLVHEEHAQRRATQQALRRRR